VIVVDDEVDTGSSLSQAVSMVRRKAREVIAVFVHPVF
jgi:phosphoribosylpyrophosphate synthetase